MDEWRSEFEFWTTEEEERLEALKAIIEELYPGYTVVSIQEALLVEVETNIAQESEHFKFCVSMERTSHNVGANLMKPFPPVDFEQSISEVALGGFYHYVGCGFPFDAKSLDVFSLPCTHVYHMLCFTHVCRDYGYCVALSCNRSVPPRAKHMIGLKVKSEMKESSVAGVLVVHDDVHTNVHRAKLEKGTLPTPTTIESGTDAIVDAMVVDACTDAIADSTVVDACTNDIVDAMEVDGSTDAAADGNVNDGGIESIICVVKDSILDAIEAMGIDATVEDTRGMVGASEVVCPSDVIDDIVDVEEAKGIDAAFENMRGLTEEDLTKRVPRIGLAVALVAATDMKEAKNTHNTIEACIEQNNEAGKGTEVPTDKETQSREAMGEDFMATVDMKEAVTHDTTESCIDPTVGNTKGKSPEVPMD
ncbi:hypothetical protein L7F22_057054 [Adiantum nelumboides]|nr:hypothetical protein [Adiantum nelumboides]